MNEDIKAVLGHEIGLLLGGRDILVFAVPKSLV